MDTIPFNLLMLVVDFALLWALWLLPIKRSLLWALLGPLGAGFIGLLAIVFFAKLLNNNVGQCICHGLFWHGGFFLILCAAILLLRGRWRLAFIPITFSILAFVTGFYALVYEPYALQLEHYVIYTPKLKKPLRVAFLADIQTDRLGPYEHDTLRMLMEQQPHLIILGGDYLQLYMGGKPGEMEELTEQFRTLLKSHQLTAPLGVFAVGGNLDPAGETGAMEKVFEGTGVTIHTFTRIYENLGGDSPDSFGPIDLTLLMKDVSFNEYQGDMPKTGNFHIMVGHSPAFMVTEAERPEIAPDLMLAGHTHGGQVVLPFFGALGTHLFTKRDRPLPREWGASGFYPIGNNKWVLISRGSGMERGWAPRVRFFCPPEISVIDILPGEAGKSD